MHFWANDDAIKRARGSNAGENEFRQTEDAVIVPLH